MEDMELLRRRLEREEKARKDAELFIEEKSLELFLANEKRNAIEALEEERRRFLERTVLGEPLEVLLAALAAMAGKQVAGGRCVIMVLPERSLHHEAGSTCVAEGAPEQAAPSAAKDRIADDVEVVDDLQDDPVWGPCLRSEPLLGMSAGWLMPIFTGDRKLVGHFGIHFTTARLPEPADLRTMRSLNHLATLAIEHFRLGAELTHQAQYDALTDLPNRALFRDRLDQAIALAARGGSMVGVLFFDLDGFKRINDTLGHLVGDKVLIESARRLGGGIRKSDTLARMGGDEFMMVLNAPKHPSDIAVVAQKCLDAISKPIPVDGKELSIGASVGISIYPEDAQDSAEAQRHADMAMYRAKAAGKNCFQFYTPDLTEEAMERLDLENHLRQALERRELALVYQPQFAIGGRLLGFEALCRWKHPKLGMIPPAKFIPIAEECGLILSIGDWVLREACLQLAKWREAGHRSFTMAVNVSTLQFERRSWAETVGEVLRETGVPAASLELELTESVVMGDVKEASVRLNQLRRLGVRFAIDDFGTGYSSLGYLQRLPIDTLKIDQSFIQDIDTTPGAEISSTTIITAILALAQGLNLGVIAEGVET